MASTVRRVVTTPAVIVMIAALSSYFALAAAGHSPHPAMWVALLAVAAASLTLAVRSARR